jgi:uncharacterized protein
MYKNLISALVFVSAFVQLSAQTADTAIFQKYYYPNGNLSSEGTLYNGKPDGFWVTYYPTGIKKSEGKRTHFLLDSIWVFFSQSGDTLEKISYLLGKKNGFAYTYFEQTNFSGHIQIRSKTLYVNDIREGQEFTYFENSTIKKLVSYKNGHAEGLSYEYNEQGLLQSISTYHNNAIIEKEEVNRLDSLSRKQGKWVTFFANTKLHIEENYSNGLLHGLYKEYNESGILIASLRYDKGNLADNPETEPQIEIKNEYFSSGSIKSSGTFKNAHPIGVQREYNLNGDVIASKLYNDSGILIGQGIISDAGEKSGKWEDYYENGKIKAVGNFSKNKKSGIWYYYNQKGTLIQSGSFLAGKPDGTWVWYYANGKVLREENYVNGFLEGPSVEYDTLQNITEKGNYMAGEKTGYWIYTAGDYSEEGLYEDGVKQGKWIAHFSNGKICFEGSFIQGKANGKHKLYYDNGLLREERFYVMGIREGNWRKYKNSGELSITITYQNDRETKINGFRID